MAANPDLDPLPGPRVRGAIVNLAHEWSLAFCLSPGYSLRAQRTRSALGYGAPQMGADAS
jgi:hypothetical protein